MTDDGPPNDRLLAMVRKSLLLDRPMTEVDAICETLQRRLAARAPADTGELEHLRRWKAEGLEVLNGWERVWRELGMPGRLGQSKASAVLDEVKRRHEE